MYCAECGAVYVGTSVASARPSKRYYYYSYSRRKRHYDRRTKALSCPHVGAEWLEETVWADVRRFLENPEDALEDARAQFVAADEDGELEARLASLTKRLATKQAEKDRYVRAFAQGHISEDELALYVKRACTLARRSLATQRLQRTTLERTAHPSNELDSELLRPLEASNLGERFSHAVV